MVGRDQAVLDLEPQPPLQRGTIPVPTPREHCVDHCHHTVLDLSDSAAQTSGIASLAPLTLRDGTTFSSPRSSPCLGPITRPGTTPSPGGEVSRDPWARKRTCRRVPLRQSALLSSSVRREVREAPVPEAALPPTLPPPAPRSGRDGSLLTTRSSLRTTDTG